jgi:hypothetical protein
MTTTKCHVPRFGKTNWAKLQIIHKKTFTDVGSSSMNTFYEISRGRRNFTNYQKDAFGSWEKNVYLGLAKLAI